MSNTIRNARGKYRIPRVHSNLKEAIKAKQELMALGYTARNRTKVRSKQKRTWGGRLSSGYKEQSPTRGRKVRHRADNTGLGGAVPPWWISL
jgi:hypothetical protein